MEEKRKQLEETIKSIISDSPLFEKIMSELDANMYKVKIHISPKNGILVHIVMNIPKWEAKFAASHPKNGGFYTVKFEDGNHGMVNIKTDDTFEPLCKLTDAYKDKIFHSFDDAVEALYASIIEFGSLGFKEKQ